MLHLERPLEPDARGRFTAPFTAGEAGCLATSLEDCLDAVRVERPVTTRSADSFAGFAAEARPLARADAGLRKASG